VSVYKGSASANYDTHPPILYLPLRSYSQDAGIALLPIPGFAHSTSPRATCEGDLKPELGTSTSRHPFLGNLHSATAPVAAVAVSLTATVDIEAVVGVGVGVGVAWAIGADCVTQSMTAQLLHGASRGKRAGRAAASVLLRGRRRRVRRMARQTERLGIDDAVSRFPLQDLGSLKGKLG
jgi:hypothetical protein